MKKMYLLLLASSLFLLSSCSGGSDTGSSGQMDYDQTKKMIVDILKTDDGKKAIQDVMSDEKMKQKLIMDQSVVTDTIEKTLTSDKGAEFWKKAFEDPKFTEAMAKSMKKQDEKLLKDLMKDPEYQGLMLDLMKDPDYQKEVLQTLKSKEYREHLQTVILETVDNPLFKTKIQALLMKASQDMKSGGQGQQGQQQGQGGGQGQGQGQQQGQQQGQSS
ncbi:spore germination lipoprotein GerD [Falsibacillus pallidus]|uniref:spore germination lipoprotein GerD n=1 Tax=Falsibacillus pallidus TaxID=493781 RepID=UPI003D9682C2